MTLEPMGVFEPVVSHNSADQEFAFVHDQDAPSAAHTAPEPSLE